MYITRPGALGLLHETLQDLRRGLFGARSVPTRHGAMFSHNVCGRDHGIVIGVEQPEYLRRSTVAARCPVGLGGSAPEKVLCLLCPSHDPGFPQALGWL